MKIHYLVAVLCALLMSIVTPSQASSFSVYPSQYRTYNQSAAGETEQHAFQHPGKSVSAAEKLHSEAGTGQVMPGRESHPHPQAAATADVAHSAELLHPNPGTALKYICPMHPDVVSDSPGHCPICGMALVSLCTAPKGQHLAQQTLPSLSDMPGMTTKGKPAASPVPGAGHYVCPMHPEIVRDAPGHCPICGMNLVQKTGHMHAAQQGMPQMMTPVKVAPQQAAMPGMSGGDKPQALPALGKTHYVCPMHPEIVRDAPGHCPICGMNLVKKTGPMHAAQQGMPKMMPSMGKAPRQAAMTEMSAKDKPQALPALGPAHYVCPMHPEIVRDAPGHCPICGMDLVQKAGHQHPMEPAAAPEVSLSPAVVQKMGVRTAQVTRGSLTQSYKTMGRVRYDERHLTDVISRTFGWVENLSVLTDGAIVQRGQLLLELYSPEYLDVQKAFLAAQQQDHSAGQLKRYGAREQTVPSRDYLRYMEVPESAINELARTGKPRFRLPIYAPQYGVIIRHEVHKHMYVAPGQLMFTIADLSSVWVEVELFEQQLSWLRRKLKAELQVDALPGQKLQGWVNYIYPELDPRTRTVTVRLLVANPDGMLRPNMLAQVEIFAEPKTDILTIPREALIDTGESQRVILALGDGHFRAIEVAAGLSSQGRVEIVRGLKEGEKVVVSGQFLIDSEANLQASLSRYGADGDGQGHE